MGNMIIHLPFGLQCSLILHLRQQRYHTPSIRLNVISNSPSIYSFTSCVQSFTVIDIFMVYMLSNRLFFFSSCSNEWYDQYFNNESNSHSFPWYYRLLLTIVSYQRLHLLSFSRHRKVYSGMFSLQFTIKKRVMPNEMKASTFPFKAFDFVCVSIAIKEFEIDHCERKEGVKDQQQNITYAHESFNIGPSPRHYQLRYHQFLYFDACNPFSLSLSFLYDHIIKLFTSVGWRRLFSCYVFIKCRMLRESREHVPWYSVSLLA